MSDNLETKVVLKYKGEVDKEFDLTNPEDITALKRTAEKGRYWEKNEESFHKRLKDAESKAEIANNWDAYLNSIKSGNVPVDDLYNTFDKMGIKLTKQQKQDVSDDLFDGEENKHLTKLEKEIEQLKGQISESKSQQLSKEIERTFKSLEKKYDGKDGLPKFDADEIADFVKRKNLYMDSVEETYENAYYLMNRQAIIDAERDRTADQRRKLEQERRRVSEGDLGGVGKFQFTEPVNTKKSYNQIAQDILADMHKQNMSIFKE